MHYKFRSLGEMFNTLTPEYTNYGFCPFVATFQWDRRVYEFIETVSATRCEKRRQTYLIPGELGRANRSIRFGNVKTGHGYTGERPDFCLIGASCHKGHLVAFYRRLELIGGLYYDLALFAAVEDALGPLRRVTLMTYKADTFTRKGNSNEKLFYKLKEFHAEAGSKLHPMQTRQVR